jgi:hypothetical protein
MSDKWNKLREYINEIDDSSYEDAVWGTCYDILARMDTLESEEENND